MREGTPNMFKKIMSGFILFSSIINPTVADQPEIAITIDDLPFVGSRSGTAGDISRGHDRFMRILNTLVETKVPVTGFVIAGAIGKGQWDLLELFQKEGFQLGNHTYSHPSLNSMSADNYIANIDKADQILNPIMTSPKYFRYPYLAEARGEKKQKVYNYLAEHGYTIAPVTIDTKDYNFNAQLLAVNWRLRDQKIDGIKKRYLAYIEKQTERAEKKAQANGKAGKQILLIHSNLLNSYCLSDIIELYKQRGYRFISLEEALDKSRSPSEIAPIQAKAAASNKSAVPAG